ncbi:hypothetical protein [uncultured Psychroserpens sp.]|uniref:hypothetical protein n=1 Tax=uncultured Psychroserpens sp. TaxID=255436 RepID=UPI0026275456|nr:hypothetical protein [uncultured Psychroserpens sp.]
MGLFDFFNKKNSKNTPNNKTEHTSENELFKPLEPYYAYLMCYTGMQQQGNYAPISAYEKPNGELVGFLYVFDESGAYSLNSDVVVELMKERFEKELATGQIKSYAILYHSEFDSENKSHDVALQDDEFKSISIAYGFNQLEKGHIAMPYTFDEEGINYHGLFGYSHEENNAVFKTQLEEKDYFQDRATMEIPAVTNDIGLTITKSNTHGLNSTWSGIFGFDRFNNKDGSQILKEYFALAMAGVGDDDNSGIVTSNVSFDDVDFKGVLKAGDPITLMPVIKTQYVVDVEHRDIQEWENVDNLEAIVSGKARDTFGIWYYATDYAEHRSRYLNEKNLNIHISGIAFVLDIHTNDKSGEVSYSDEFTGYFPSKDMPNFGCFDFIGDVEDFRETSLLDDHSLKAYIMTVRLITNDEIKDFFTIDMYVTPENMRFETLTKGMKVTGMFQMQGCISDS